MHSGMLLGCRCPHLSPVNQIARVAAKFGLGDICWRIPADQR
jgi:hypothetical protein